MRKTSKQSAEPAPAFSAWLKKNEEAEHERAQLARKQLDALQAEVSLKGYLLARDDATDDYLMYVAENATIGVTNRQQLHFVRYVIVIDVRRQELRVTRCRGADRPPVLVLAKPFTLETAVRAYVRAIAKECPSHAPRLSKDDEPAQ